MAAAANTLSVNLTANTQGLQNGLNSAGQRITNFNTNANGQFAGFNRSVATMERQLRLFQNGLRNATDVNRINMLNRAIDQTRANLTATNNAINQQSGLQNLSQGSNQASMALMNLGRVAQDAPFGFIGIANNLNPLLESFQRLRVESGSNAVALRALGMSLIGGGGIGLALSAVTAIMTFSQMGFRAWTGSAKKAKEEAEDYGKTLGTLARAHYVGTQEVQKEKIELESLYDVATDVTIAYETRKKAVDSLQQLYPDYFKNIKDEAILTGDAAESYRKLRLQILATSKARAAQGLMDESAKGQVEATFKSQEIENKITERRLKLAKDLQKVEDDKGKRVGFAKLVDDSDLKKSSLQYVAQKEINKLIEERNILFKSANTETAKQERLQALVVQQVKAGADIFEEIDKPKNSGKGRSKDVKDLSDVLRELNIDLLQVDNSFQTTFEERSNDKIKAHQKAIDELIKMGYAPASKAVEALKKAQQDLFQLPAIGSSPSIEPKAGKPVAVQGNIKSFYNVKSITDEQEAILRSQIKFNDDFNNLISKGLTSGISGLANAFGEVLANGGNAFEALGASLLGSLGGVLTQLGEMAIGVGVGLVAIKKALQSLNPVVAIAAGVALVALGGYVSAKASSIGGGISSGSGRGREATAFANGGIISGPTLGLMGEYAGAKNNPEVVAPLSKLTSLMGIDKDGNKIGRNNEPIIMVADMVLKGEDQYISFKRVEKRLGRV